MKAGDGGGDGGGYLVKTVELLFHRGAQAGERIMKENGKQR